VVETARHQSVSHPVDRDGQHIFDARKSFRTSSGIGQKLREKPDALLAWEPISLDFYAATLPETIRSSWVFIMRANTTTGAERHPNSHQRRRSPSETRQCR
jgi:hypothetical protein